MIAAELFSRAIPPLSSGDTIQRALEKMTDFKLSHFPIVDGNHFLGLISEEELVEVRDPQTKIKGIKIGMTQAFVTDETHIYDVIRLFSQFKLTTVPVLNKNKEYLGLISINSVLEYAASVFSSNEPGAILVLEISHRNYSLAQMAQIVEADNAQILSSYVRTFPDSTRMEVTLKINKSELSGLIAAFERYNYQVTAVYNSISDGNDTDDRYNSLMNYLNV